MIPGILARYITRRFTASVLVILAGMSLLVFLIDFIEFLRRFSDKAEFSAGMGFYMALLRAPNLSETVLPFAFLFGAMVGLLGLSRRLELVVVRASGVSVWRFLAGPFAVAIGFGLLSTFVINPFAVAWKDRADQIEASLTGADAPRDQNGIWFRQDSVDGPSVIYARRMGEDGLSLLGPTAFVFDQQGRFREKAVANTATFSSGRWVFRNATVITAERPPQAVEAYIVPTNLTRSQLRQTLQSPQALSIWSLPGYIEAAGRTGLNTDRYRLELNTLLGRPVFLAAMVAIAATVSLRLFRQGGIGRLVVTGVGSGFLLYVVTEIVSDLGENGVVDPALAAWLPSVVALTFGATALLHLEDG
ncbi:LPS export ABC transporter permease LptG [Propylenella binzhouense]|uniref:LPS export ABC transporter permease LptG n=1 Tax=Propylenella binzhouense TaxID=2555902 RepID=UPI00136960C2